MFRLNRISRSGNSSIFRVIWIFTAVIIFVGFGLGSESTISSWVRSHDTRGPELIGQSNEHIMHGLGASREVAQESPHLLHGLVDTSTRQNDGEVSSTIEAVVQGHWIGHQIEDTSGTNECTVEVVSVDLELKEYGGGVYGFGSYSLGIEDCPLHGDTRPEYVAVTGTYAHPDLDLTLRNTMTGEIDLEYHATIQLDEISGAVGHVGSDTVIENVSLFRR